MYLEETEKVVNVKNLCDMHDLKNNVLHERSFDEENVCKLNFTIYY